MSDEMSKLPVFAGASLTPYQKSGLGAWVPEDARKFPTRLLNRGIDHEDYDLMGLLETIQPFEFDEMSTPSSEEDHPRPSSLVDDEHSQIVPDVDGATILPRTSEIEVEWLLSSDALNGFEFDVKLTEEGCSADGTWADLVETLDTSRPVHMGKAADSSITLPLCSADSATGRLEFGHPTISAVLQVLNWRDHGLLLSGMLEKTIVRSTDQPALQWFSKQIHNLLRSIVHDEVEATVERDVEWHRTRDQLSTSLQMLSRKTIKRTAQGSDFDQVEVDVGGPRRGQKLDVHASQTLRRWIIAHQHNPYPDEDEKDELALQTGLRIEQINNWFINARRRILKKIKNVPHS